MQTPKRILVVGPPGAGKSSFCKKLAPAISLPLYHLDDYYWLENWVRVSKKRWLQTLRELCSKPTWVIDGNHATTFKRRAIYTDLVIMLDYSPTLCFWRFLKRSVRRYFKFNDNLPVNIEESNLYKPTISIQWHLLKLIFGFRFSTKPNFIAFLSNINCPIVILKSNKAAGNYLKALIQDRKA